MVKEQFKMIRGVAILATLLLLVSCDKEEAGEGPVIPPAELLSPSSGTNILLDSDQTDPVVFSWKGVKANDGTFVFYKILFDVESGDFSNPIMERRSDRQGEATTASLFRPSLNELAELAGNIDDSPVTIKWMVVADNGMASSRSEQPFSFTLQVS